MTTITNAGRGALDVLDVNTAYSYASYHCGELSENLDSEDADACWSAFLDHSSSLCGLLMGLYGGRWVGDGLVSFFTVSLAPKLRLILNEYMNRWSVDSSQMADYRSMVEHNMNQLLSFAGESTGKRRVGGAML